MICLYTVRKGLCKLKERLGFIPDICKILCEYNLQYILNYCWDIARLPSNSQWKKQVKTAVHSRYSLLWRHMLYCHSDFTRFRKLHTSVAPAVVWKISYSGSVTLLPGYGHPFQTQAIAFACIVSVIIETLIPTNSQSVCVPNR